MQRARIIAPALALLLAGGCKKNNPTAQPTPRADAAVAARADASAAGPAGELGPVPEAPANALLHGARLGAEEGHQHHGARRADADGAREVLPGFTPGIGDQALDVDPDAPFVVVIVPAAAEGPDGRLSIVAAWPLRPGMEIAQRAQAGRGFRETSPGLYEPTEASVAGATGGAPTLPCWVARRPTIGWVMLCGPRDHVRPNAQWLVRAGDHGALGADRGGRCPARGPCAADLREPARGPRRAGPAARDRRRGRGAPPLRRGV